MSVARGTLLFSLDFELHWGLRDRFPADGGSYRNNLLGVRAAVPRLLDLFARYELAATWATVGMLFASSRDELLDLWPSLRPHYPDPRLDPYREQIGADEGADPLHYAPSLIKLIQTAPRQEIGSHTFSHYYCLEPGHSRESFRADLDAAVRAAAPHGIELRSLVLPRNQLNPAFASEILAAGFRVYRGNPRGWMYRPVAGADDHLPRRLSRLIDTYVDLGGDGVTSWDCVRGTNGLCNLPASRFFRPWSSPLRALEPLRIARIERSMARAAERGGIFHLWCHPHNFGVDLEANLRTLERVLVCFARLREQGRMRSMTMSEAAEVARA